MASEREIWNSFRISPGDQRFWKIGDLHLWIQVEKFDVSLAWKHARIEGPGEEADKDELPPEARKWTRWILESSYFEFELKPRFPERPVIIEASTALHLPRGTSARIYVHVPVWVEVIAKSPAQTVTLAEVPSIILSRTWFGDQQEGELCYWLATRAQLKTGQRPPSPHRVICPIQITNSSESHLKVQDFCLHVEYLSIFRHKAGFWSDETRVTFQGIEQVSAVRVAGVPPEEARGAGLLVAPRSSVRKSFAARIFSTLNWFPA
ncbi:MAG TPA: DUF432 domain-containing protein [Acidobacteriota bacterium]|nr:DUF432 domain-containing protein [Acidobacteriota bacterium]